MKRTFSDQSGSWCRFFVFFGERSVVAMFKTPALGVCFFCFACFFALTNSAYSEDVDAFSEKKAQTLRVTETLLAMQEVCKAVVNIEGDRKQSSLSNHPEEVVGKAYNGMGTGMIIDPRGYIVTNHHVIEGLEKIKVQTYEQAQAQILDPKDKRYYIGTVVVEDDVTDLAIIKINGKEPFASIKIGVSAEILWGEEAYAIGNPYGYPFTITKGLISGLFRDVEVNEKLTYAKAIQTDVAINPGNSGGPLLNADGEVVGINAAIRSGAENIAFAIPIDQVVDIAARLIIQNKNRTIYHGIHLKKSDASGRIVIESVEPGSPAEQSGLQAEDRLIAGNQIEFHRPLDFARSLLELKKTDALNLVLMRAGEPDPLETNLQLIAAKPRYYQGHQSNIASNAKKTMNSNQLSKIATVAPNPRVAGQVTQARDREMRAWEYLGIKFTTIPMDVYKQQYAQYLSEYPDGAIRVSSIRPNSPMFNCGIEPGDIVFTIDSYASFSEERVDAIILELQKNKRSKKPVKVLLNRPRPYDGLAANGYFFTDMELQ